MTRPLARCTKCLRIWQPTSEAAQTCPDCGGTDTIESYSDRPEQAPAPRPRLSRPSSEPDEDRHVGSGAPGLLLALVIGGVFMLLLLGIAVVGGVFWTMPVAGPAVAMPGGAAAPVAVAVAPIDEIGQPMPGQGDAGAERLPAPGVEEQDAQPELVEELPPPQVERQPD